MNKVSNSNFITGGNLFSRRINEVHQLHLLPEHPRAPLKRNDFQLRDTVEFATIKGL